MEFMNFLQRGSLSLVAQVRQYRAIVRDVEKSSDRAVNQYTKEIEHSSSPWSQNDVDFTGTWESNSPHNPRNWSTARKWTYTAIVCMTNLITRFEHLSRPFCSLLKLALMCNNFPTAAPHPSTPKSCPRPCKRTTSTVHPASKSHYWPRHCTWSASG